MSGYKNSSWFNVRNGYIKVDASRWRFQDKETSELEGLYLIYPSIARKFARMYKEEATDYRNTLYSDALAETARKLLGEYSKSSRYNQLISQDDSVNIMEHVALMERVIAESDKLANFDMRISTSQSTFERLLSKLDISTYSLEEKPKSITDSGVVSYSHKAPGAEVRINLVVLSLMEYLRVSVKMGIIHHIDNVHVDGSVYRALQDKFVALYQYERDSRDRFEKTMKYIQTIVDPCIYGPYGWAYFLIRLFEEKSLRLISLKSAMDAVLKTGSGTTATIIRSRKLNFFQFGKGYHLENDQVIIFHNHDDVIKVPAWILDLATSHIQAGNTSYLSPSHIHILAADSRVDLEVIRATVQAINDLRGVASAGQSVQSRDVKTTIMSYLYDDESENEYDIDEDDYFDVLKKNSIIEACDDNGETDVSNNVINETTIEHKNPSGSDSDEIDLGGI